MMKQRCSSRYRARCDTPPSFPPPHSGRSHLNLKLFVYGVIVSLTIIYPKKKYVRTKFAGEPCGESHAAAQEGELHKKSDDARA